MASIYELEYNGNIYEVEGPDGASPEQLARALSRKLEIDRRVEEQRQSVDRTIGGEIGEFFRAIPRGAMGMAETAGTGIAALLSDENEAAVRDTMRGWTESVGEKYAPKFGYEEGIARDLGEGVGSLAPFLAAALLPGAALPVVAGVGMGTAAGAGEARRRAEDAGATDEQRAEATALGMIPGSLEALPPFRILARSLGRGNAEGLIAAVRELAGKKVGSLSRVTDAALEEGVQEAASEVAQNLIAQGIYDPSQGAFTNTGESFGLGAGVGGLVQAIAELALPGRARGGADVNTDAEESPPMDDEVGAPPMPQLQQNGITDLLQQTDYDQPAYRRNPKRRGEAEQLNLFRGLTPQEVQTAPEEEVAPEVDPNQMDLFAAADEQLRDAAERREQERLAAEREAAWQKAEEQRARQERRQEKRKADDPLRALNQLGEEKTENAVGALKGLDPTPQPTAMQLAMQKAQEKAAANPPPAPPPQRNLFPGITPREQPRKEEEPEAEQEVDPNQRDLFTAADEQLRDAAEKKEQARIAAEREEAFAKAERERAKEEKRKVDDPIRALNQVGDEQLELAEGALKGQNETPTPTAMELAFRRAQEKKKVVEPTQDPSADTEQAGSAVPGTPSPDSVPASTSRGETPVGGERVADAAPVESSQVPADSTPVAEAQGEQATPQEKKDEPEPPAVDTSAGEVTAGNTEGPAKATPAEGQEVDEIAAPRETPAEPVSQSKTRRKHDDRKESARRDVGSEPDEAGSPTDRRRGEAGKNARVESGQPKSSRSSPTVNSTEVEKAARSKDEDQVQSAEAEDAQLFKAQAKRAESKKTDQEKVDAAPENSAIRKYAKKGAKIADIIRDIAGNPPAATREARQWIKNNLSPETNKELARAVIAARTDFNLYMPKEAAEDVEQLVKPVGRGVANLVRAGNLAGALRLLGSSKNSRLAKAARRLADNIGDTKVQIVDDLEEAGSFDGATNTISFHPDYITAHSLIHEVAHAVTMNTLVDKSHPMTRRLEALFKDVRENIVGEYGATNVYEFVAEVFSNDEFRAKLARTPYKGAPKSNVPVLGPVLDAIRNFLRRMMGFSTDGSMGALDIADILIDQIIAPAPSLGAPIKLALTQATGQDQRDFINKYVYAGLTQGRLKIDPEKAQFYTGALRKLSDATQRFIYGSLPVNNLADLVRVKRPELAKFADKYHKLASEMAKEIEDGREKTLATQKYLSQLFTNKPALLADVEKLANDSTSFELDGAEAPLDINPLHAPGYYAKDPQRAAGYKVLRARFDALPPEGQKAFRMMVETNKVLKQQGLEVLKGRIADVAKASGKHETDIISARDKLLKHIMDKYTIDPYFRLDRKGKYRLSYMHKDSGYTVEFFESYDARQDAMEKLKKDPKLVPETLHAFQEFTRNDFRNAPPTAFVSKVIAELDNLGLGDDVDITRNGQTTRVNLVNELIEAFMDYQPELALTAGGRGRLGTAGFRKDAVNVLIERAQRVTRELAALKFTPKLSILEQEMMDYADKEDLVELENSFLETMRKHIQFARNPQLATWSNVLRNAGFTMTLGANVSHVVVNASAIPTVVYPILGGKFGFNNARKSVMRAARMYISTGGKGKIKAFATDENGKDVEVEIANGWSFRNIDWSDDAAIKKAFPTEDLNRLKKYKTLFDVAGERGELTHYLAQDAEDGQLSSIGPKKTLWTKLAYYSGVMAHHGERMNRQVTMLAAYDLAIDKLGKNPTEEQLREAAEEALSLMEFTNSSALRSTGPQLAQTNLGSILYMFKRYGISMTAMQLQLAKKMFKDPEARRQILGLYATSGVLSGIQGMPAFGVIAALANLLFLDDEDPDFESMLEGAIGSGLMNGALNELTGLSVAERIGLSNLIVRSRPNAPEERLSLQLLETLGGPVFGVATRAERGFDLMSQGEVQRGMEQIMPTAISNAFFKGPRFFAEGATTMRGDPITEDIGAWNIVGQMLGFAPDGYLQQMETNSMLKRIDNAITSRAQNLRREYYFALRQGDSQKVREVLDEIGKFNKKYPAAPIDAKSLRASVKTHIRTSGKMVNGITLTDRTKIYFDDYIPTDEDAFLDYDWEDND